MKQFLKKLVTGKSKYFVLGLLIIVLVISLMPDIALAKDVLGYDSLGGGLKGVVLSIFAYFFLALINFLGAYLLVPLINLFVNIVQYNGFLGSYAVEIGWPLVRDVANMFFVVILLVIAFSTILKISQYHYKATLFKLLLMAILVNFSKQIMGFLIDFGQVIMLTFVNAFKDAAAYNLVYSFGLAKMLKMDADISGPINAWEIFASLFLGVVLLVIAIGVMLAYVAVILYRIISLWVLVILSPLAFFFSAFPGLSKYAGEYWSKFWNALTTGIILAFFLWLALMILAAGTSSDVVSVSDQVFPDRGNSTKGFDKLSTSNLGDDENITMTESGATAISAWENIYNFIIAITLLLLALQYAQQAGGFAGSFAGKVSGKLSDIGSKTFKAATWPAKKGVDLAKFGGKRVFNKVGRGIQDYSTAKGKDGSWFRKKAKYLTKGGWEGYMKRGDDMNTRAKDRAIGYAHDEANSLVGIKSTHGVNAGLRAANKAAEELHTSGKEDVMFQFEATLDMPPSRERDDIRNGLLAIASKNGYIDDLMSIESIKQDLMTKDEREGYIGEDGLKVAGYDERVKFHEVATKKIIDGLDAGIRQEALDLGLKADSDEYKEYINNPDNQNDYIEYNVKEAMKKEFFGSTGKVDEGVELVNRQKTGQFLEKYISTSSVTGKQSDEAMALIHQHEETSRTIGHNEQGGYVRKIDGKYKFMDYEKKNAKGLTEADEEALVEDRKMDPKKLAQAHYHAFANIMADGSAGKSDAYQRTLLAIASGSDEAYKQNYNTRAAERLLESDVNKKPIVILDNGIKALGIATSGLNKVCSRLADPNTRRAFSRMYDKQGGEFFNHDGEKETIRNANAKDSFVVLDVEDKGEKKQVGFSLASGMIVDAIPGKNKDGGDTFTFDRKLGKKIEDFMEDQRMYQKTQRKKKVVNK